MLFNDCLWAIIRIIYDAYLNSLNFMSLESNCVTEQLHDANAYETSTCQPTHPINCCNNTHTGQ